MPKTGKKKRFVVCVRNTGYPASLELRKIYEALPGDDARTHGLVRIIIDESGDDYLYPSNFFKAVDLPQEVATAVRRAAGGGSASAEQGAPPDRGHEADRASGYRCALAAAAERRR